MEQVKNSSGFIYKAYFFLTLFTYTEGFGLRADGAWGGLGNASVGPFGMLQLLLIGLSAYFMITSGKQVFCKGQTSSTAVKLFLFLFIVIIIQLFFQSLGDLEKLVKYNNLIKLKHWILLFSIPVLYNKLSLNSIINILKLSGLLSAIVVLYVITNNVGNTAIIIHIGGTATHAFRVIIPTSSIITLAFCLYLASYKNTKSTVDIVGAMICFLATFIQLHRSSTLALILMLVLFLLVEYKFSPGKMVVILVGGLVLLSVLFNAVGYSFEMLEEVFTASRDAISEGEDAGTSMRFGMIWNGITYVISNYIILGIGLDWDPLTDTEMYNFLQFARTPTGDNGYYNIIIVFGLLGIALFLYMLFILVLSAYKSKRLSLNNIRLNILCTAVLYFFIYNAIVAMGGDRFFRDAIFPVVIGIILMNEKMIRNTTLKI